MTEPTKALATALVAAQAAAQAVEKNGRNQAMRYNFASAEGLIQEARDALASAGLALVATRWDVKWVETRSSLIVEYLLVHVSGEQMKFSAETAIVPGNGRPQDKAEASALTFSLGYFLRSLLLLPRVEPGSQVDERKDVDTPLTPTLLASVKEQYLKAIATAPTVAELTSVYTRIMASTLTNEEKTHLKGECTVRRGQIEGTP